MTEHRLLDVSALDDGEAVTVEFEDRAFACARIGDEFFVIDDTCTHAKVSLGDGIVDEDDCTLECPKHGALFSLRSGEALTFPAINGVKSYPVDVREAAVFVRIEEEQA